MSVFEPMVDRIIALGAHEEETDAGALLADIYRVASTLLQGSGGDYCACMTIPCGCVMVFMDDLAQCIEVRHPDVARAARPPAPADPDQENGEET